MDGIGSTIKKWAVFISVANAIISLILGISLMSQDPILVGLTAPIGLIIIIGGIVASIMLGLLLYGFGELVENSAESEKHLQVIKNRQEELSRQIAALSRADERSVDARAESARAAVGKTQNETTNVTRTPSKSRTNPVEAQGTSDKNGNGVQPGVVTCPVCGALNGRYRTKCISCGRDFFRTNQ